MDLEFQSAISEYWKAIGAEGDPPIATDSQFDAFIEALGISKKNQFSFDLAPPIARFYPTLALDPKNEEVVLRWAAELAELEVFYFSGNPARLFFVDTLPDKTNNHRVYSWEEKARTDVEFWSLASALRWMTIDTQKRSGELGAEIAKAAQATEEAFLDDEWETEGHSGMSVLEELLALPFARAWHDLARANWPVLEGDTASHPKKKDPQWQRKLALWLVYEFIQHRHARLPAGFKKDDLSRANRALLEHLMEFEECIAFGDAPKWMFDLASAEDSQLARQAEMWIQEYQSSRKVDDLSPAEDTGDEPVGEGAAAEISEPQTPFQKQLTLVLAKMVEDMAARGDIELQEERKEDLTHELVVAASDARSMDHMIKRIAGTLIDSSLVDEVYANDDDITRDLRARFGEGR